MTDSVLLIHDDPGQLRALVARFEQAGAEVFQESSGGAGATAFDRNRPDVVCLAIHLGVSDPALVTRLSSQEALLVAFGEGVTASDAAAVMKAGASRLRYQEPGRIATCRSVSRLSQ